MVSKLEVIPVHLLHFKIGMATTELVKKNEKKIRVVSTQ
jgi:hypothetical protein